MAEGHTVHALRARLSAAFLDHPVRASSPQGRFEDGAAVLDGRVVTDVEAHGKHLFVTVDDPVLHVHLGMYGRFSVRQHRRVRPIEPPTDLPGAHGQRLRLVSLTHVGDLRAPTVCEILDRDGVDEVRRSLGPDPIRADADPDAAWRTLRASGRTVAELLMDQRVVAGIGNVYRAELLYRAALDPYTPGRDVPYEVWERLWQDAVDLMTLGAEVNRILTTTADLEHARTLLLREQPVPRLRPRYAVYGRSGRPCPRCGRLVAAAQVAGRRLYWCPTCQRPPSPAGG